MASDAEITSLADVPGYKAILKAVLKTQIQGLVEQLAHHTDEESVLLTANVSDGTISHLGSNSGRTFLTSQDDLKSQFLGFCIKMHHQQTFADPNRSAKSNIQPTLDSLKSTSSQKNPSRRHSGNKQRSVPYNIKNRPLQPASTKAPVLSDDTGPVPVSVSSQDSGSGPVTDPDNNSATLVIKQEPKSDDENSTNPTNYKMAAMETENNSHTHNDTMNNTVSGQSSSSWIEPVCNDHLVDSQVGGGHQLTEEFPAVPVNDQDEQEIDNLLANTSAVKFNKKRKLSFKTYETKYAAILEVERGYKKKSEIAKQFKVPMSTLLTWMKNKTAIKQKMSGNLDPHRKTSKKPHFPELDKRLYDWYLSVIDHHIEVNALILREQACHLAKEIGMPDFESCVAGWVTRFKARHSISFKRSKTKLNTSTVAEDSFWTVVYNDDNSDDTEASNDMTDEVSCAVNMEAPSEMKDEAVCVVNMQASSRMKDEALCGENNDYVSSGSIEDLK